MSKQADALSRQSVSLMQNTNHQEHLTARLSQLTLSDDFNRPDSTTTLGGEWVPSLGTWGVAGKKARAVTTAGSVVALVDAGSPDHEITSLISLAAGKTAGLVVRGTDSANHIYVQLRQTEGVVRILKRVSSAATTLVTSYPGIVASLPVADHTLRVRCVKNLIHVYLNGALVVSHILSDTDAATFATQTLVGLQSSSDDLSRWDQVRVRNLGKQADRAGVNVWGANNAPEALITPTHDGSGQAVHPDVWDFGAGNTWNGYRYWMAHTPYAFSDVTVEEPNIIASHDGINWEVPDGLINPVSVGFDPDITMVGNRMYVISQGFIVTWSDDGITWEPYKYLFNQLTGEVSPSIIFENGVYRMWTIQKRTGQRYRALHRTATDINGPWSAPEEILMPNDILADRDLWHLDVVKHDGLYYSVVSEASEGTSGSGSRLYMATSNDGYVWSVSGEPILDKGMQEKWDDAQIYRSCIIPRGSGSTLTFDLYYSARKTSGAWRIGKTVIEKLRIA